MYGYGGYAPQSYYDMLRAQMFGQQAPQPAQPATQTGNILPPQQVIQVAGRQSIDTLQMAPNSSVLVMDKTAPIVWLCVSDGLGKVAATAYDIALHQEVPPFDVADFAQTVEARLQALESKISEVDIDADKSDARNAQPAKANEWSGSKAR